MAQHFKHKEEFFAVRDALSFYTDAWRFIDAEGTSSPLLIQLNGKKYALQVNMTHDSGSGRGNDDECRIQSNARQVKRCQELSQDGYDIIVLGFYPPLQIFSMWETAHFLAPRAETFSMYSRFTKLDEANTQDISRYEFASRVLRRQTTCINFVPALLGVMIQNHELINKLADTELKQLPKALSSNAPMVVDSEEDESATSEPSQETAIGREKITISRTAYARNPKFQKAVLASYGYSCCVCGLQLNIVEAAHIIPHNNQGCVDTVQNGLALCIQHHRSYDTALLIPHADYKMRINPERVAYLKSIKRIKGIEIVEQFHEKELKLPTSQRAWPKREFLQQGFLVRTGANREN